MTIRPATPHDLPDLADIHARAFARGWGSQSLKALLSGPGVSAFLMEDDEICGFILVRVAADEAEILTIAVGPDRRQKGLGSGLLEHAALAAREGGASHMFLEVAAQNLPARNLYEKYGFREVGRRKAYYEDGDDALVLSAGLPLMVGNSGKTF
ncbi:MAG TPA: ribosomal protein S18-alanine N-acetyltransferase [Rhizomicrobium sp.]